MAVEVPEDDYDRAKANPVAALILDALHEQDARTYHGQSGEIGALALATADKIDTFVRKAERHRLADLLEDHRMVVGGFADDKWKLYDLLVYLLRLDHS